MIRIHQIKCKPEDGREKLIKKAAGILRIAERDILELQIVKRSLDARKKPDLFYSYVVDVKVAKEDAIFKKASRGPEAGNLSLTENVGYKFPEAVGTEKIKRPVVVGMGPAGLFCGYYLAKAGYAPIILERGKDVDARQKDVDAFWNGGKLCPESNVQFGEGGAGTFSDGKLNTLVKDKYGRNGEVLRLLHAFGAPEEILYESKPHIGTDILKDVVKNIRKEIIGLGGEVCFESQVTDLGLDNGKIEYVVVNGERKLETDVVVLAIGHSARNTFEMLYDKGITMEAKPFAVGFRVEHSQKMINESQYGSVYADRLPAAAYKVTAKAADGRGVYSFCMCPGGYVVNASSEEGRLCVNGMSYSKRDSVAANSAIIVTVQPKDYGADHPLAGIAFQRALEERAYKAGEGKIPVQTYGQFKEKICGEKNGETQKEAHMEIQSDAHGMVPPQNTDSKNRLPSVKGAYAFADITGILPENLNKDIVEGMEQFAKVIKGFNAPDTLLMAVESRTSSPVRILREDSLQAKVAGLYPCGEGAGYAGGITSAAMDGIKVAEAIVQKYTIGN